MPEESTTRTRPPPFVVGLDVHQKTITVAVLDPEGQLIDRRTIRTSLQSLDQFHRDLDSLTLSRPVMLGLEASTAGQAVFRHLRDLHRDVHMAHPKKLRALFGETKTDRNDALALATVLRLGSFPEVYVPAEEMLPLRTVVRLREEVVEKLRRAKQQTRALLVKNHLQHDASKYDDIFGVQALRWLKGLSLNDPWDQKELSLLMEEGELYTRQIHGITTEMARLSVHREEVRLLQTVPGIDYVLALTIIAEVGDINRFRNRKKFAAYCGLVPRNADSGGRVARHAPLRHGNPRLKGALGLVVQNNTLLHRGQFYRLFKALEPRLGAPKARSAVAHRLAFIVYGIWKRRVEFDESIATLHLRKRQAMVRRSEEATTILDLGVAADRLIAAVGTGEVKT
jgi:transposase